MAAIEYLLPTPTASDERGDCPSERIRRSPGIMSVAGMQVDGTLDPDRLHPWGKYTEAVDRWQDLFREVPEPMIRGPKGGLKLNPKLTEWMMGLPDGHVSDLDELSWAAKVKIIGNGVCPPQAEAAVDDLLGDWV